MTHAFGARQWSHHGARHAALQAEKLHTAVAERGAREEAIGLQSFVVHFIERRDAIVPFQQRSGVTHAFDGARVQFPHGINHGMIVGIENVLAKFRMSRDVNLRDALRWDAIYVTEGIEAVILRRNVNIVHI